MKKSRMGIKRNRKRSTLVLIIIFCIILPAIAIYAGLKITERVMLPVLNNDELIPDELELVDPPAPQDDNSDNKETKLEVIETNPFTIYTVQVASLNDAQNIDKLIDSLNSEKLSYLVYKMDNSYKVYTMAAMERNIIEENISHIREYYPDSYISEIRVPARKIEYDSNSDEVHMKEITSLINELIKTMENLSIEWNNLIQKRGEKGEYVELLKKQQLILAQLSESSTQGVFPSNFQRRSSIEKMIEFQEKNIKQSIEYLEGNEGDNDYQIHTLYLDSLFRIVEVIK